MTTLSKSPREARRQTLERARQIALTAAHKNGGTVTADDIPEDFRVALGPAAGSVFKTSDFEFTGKRVNSTLKSNHAREIKVWQLTPTGAEKVRKQAEKVASHKQAEDRIHRQPVAPEIVDVASQPTPLPSWLK